MHKEQEYTSDMDDWQWATLRPLLYLAVDGPRRTLELDLRQVVNAILFVKCTGCQWENLPKDCPHYQNVYYHYSKWRDYGTCQGINQALRGHERVRQGREAEPS